MPPTIRLKPNVRAASLLYSGHRGRQLQREAAQYRRRHGAIQNLECGGVRVLHRQIGNDGARGMRERTAAHGTNDRKDQDYR